MILTHHPLLLPAIVWFLCQSLKVVIRLIGRKYDRRYLFTTGGMPSVHSATVASLTTLAGYLQGTDSFLFAACFIFGSIVVYDALNIRFQAGRHAALLNQLRNASGNERLNESLGHTPLEVLVGIALGVGLTFAGVLI